MSTDTIQILPVLPMKNAVLLPHLSMPLAVGRPSSLAAAEAALATEEKTIVLVAQRDATEEQPGADGLYSIGTRAVIRKAAHGEGGRQLLVEGVERVVLVKVEQAEPYLKARVRPLPLPEEGGPEVEALRRAIIDLAGRALQIIQPQLPVPLDQLAAQIKDHAHLAYLVGALLSLESAKAQALLEAPTLTETLRLLHGYLAREVQVLELHHKITEQAQSEMTQQQREYLLRQQLQAIQQELGEANPEKSEVEELRKRLAETDLPEEVRKEAERELNRLARLPAAAPDFQMTRTYLDLLLELPWRQQTNDVLELTRAEQILNEDHYGLHDVKERILEHLAVLQRNPQAKAPILCFVGPPGVGKTSLGQSIARALGRKFERLSLGGLHDEAELRGHRRTYIGAMPGRILQGLRRAGANNPVLMLDEVDKLGRDYRGDPAAALLEILDPAQNHAFRDNYLDLPFDLTRVLFITTANSVDTIPRPLLDRMEVIRLSGYSEEEKLYIACRYLLPRQLSAAGLTGEQLQVPDETIRRVVARYTREAGVRELERSLGRLTRKVTLRLERGGAGPVVVGPEDLVALLGPERFHHDQVRTSLPAGVATGLAWTESGGDVLYVEASLLPDGRGVRLTGQLGDVMRESARTAQAYVWAHAEALGIDPTLFRTAGVHVHVPAGAVPKDGPSAGVALATALTSAYARIPVRADTAMTGEVTLSGLVLPVGGIKEKVLAARRAGLRRVILPRANEKDLPELPEPVRRELEFVLVERIEDVLADMVPGRVKREVPLALAS